MLHTYLPSRLATLGQLLSTLRASLRRRLSEALLNYAAALKAPMGPCLPLPD